MKASMIQPTVQPTSASLHRLEGSDVEAVDSARTNAILLGFWFAALTAVLATVALAIGVMTTPRSGPFCPGSCIGYPYTSAEAASLVPGDYLWLYPAILLAPIFVVLMICIHHYASGDKKLFSQIGLSFALMYAVLIGSDYFIQLAVMQPSFLKGETEGLTLFSQYNPHGIFIALEDLGYLMMGFSFLFTALVFAGRGRLERALRWLFGIGSVGAIGSLIVLALAYGENLEYRFEVAVLSIDWTVLIVSGVLLSILFRRAGRHNSTS